MATDALQYSLTRTVEKKKKKKFTGKRNRDMPASIQLACTEIYRAGPQGLHMRSLTFCKRDSNELKQHNLTCRLNLSVFHLQMSY